MRHIPLYYLSHAASYAGEEFWLLSGPDNNRTERELVQQLQYILKLEEREPLEGATRAK